MASISIVYNALKSLANKDQRGFVTPAIFNSFAQLAQQNALNSSLGKVAAATNMRMRSIAGEKAIAQHKAIIEDISFLAKDETLTKVSGVFSRQADFFRAISMRKMGPFVLDNTSSVPVDFVEDHEKIDMILTSRLSRPTARNPVALIGQQIEVYPQSVNKVKMRYYKIPEGIVPTTGARTSLTPRYGFTELTTGREMFNPATSVDFELPDSMFPQLVIEMAKLIGINLNEDKIYVYAKTEEKEE